MELHDGVASGNKSHPLLAILCKIDHVACQHEIEQAGLDDVVGAKVMVALRHSHEDHILQSDQFGGLKQIETVVRGVHYNSKSAWTAPDGIRGSEKMRRRRGPLGTLVLCWKSDIPDPLGVFLLD